MNMNTKSWWNLDLECKPDFEASMKRIYAWYEGEIVDRVPVRFSAHNAFVRKKQYDKNWKSLKERWYDAEYQIESFMESLKGIKLLGETFPVYWPNIGPNFFAALYGSNLEFGEITSWAEPCIEEWKDINNLKLNLESEYFKKIEQLTKYALEKCQNKFMVGYTDLHPGMDCVSAWRDTQKLLFDLYDNPDEVKLATKISMKDFQSTYDHFDSMLKEKNQLSVTWMGIPSFGKMHIPSCDFSAMISPNQFEEFCLPMLQKEVKPMTHNIFHLDGRGVAKHIDLILQVPEIQAIQWVQGVNEDKAIMRWIPLIKKIQGSGKSVVVEVDKTELDEFIRAVNPEGILLCIDSNGEDEQRKILNRIERW